MNKSQNLKLKSERKKAFTLVEVLLYIALSSVILAVLVAFIGLILQTRARSQTIAEVHQQGDVIMQSILQTVRNAEGINSPTPGNTANTLSVDAVVASIDPIVYALSGTDLTVTEDINPAQTLNSNRVEISNLTFSNLSRAGTPGIVRIQFTVSYVNPDGRYEQDYSQIFYGTAAIRRDQ